MSLSCTYPVSFQSTFTSKPSSRSNVVHRAPSTDRTSQRQQSTYRPQSAKTPAIKKNFIQQNIKNSRSRPVSAAVPRAPMVEGVESRLKYNRNYQPPRRKKKPVTVTQKETVENEVKNNYAKEDYEADFESDECDVENENDVGNDVEEAVQLRQAWLLEQAVRGRARQRALNNR